MGEVVANKRLQSFDWPNFDVLDNQQARLETAVREMSQHSYRNRAWTTGRFWEEVGYERWSHVKVRKY